MVNDAEVSTFEELEHAQTIYCKTQITDCLQEVQLRQT